MGYAFGILNAALQRKIVFNIAYIREGQKEAAPSFQGDTFYEISSADTSFSMGKRSGRIVTKCMLEETFGEKMVPLKVTSMS